MVTENKIPNVTYDQLIELIKGTIEPTEPADCILKSLKAFEGKKIDQRIVKKIQTACGDDSIQLDDSYDMCHIDYGGYRFSGGRTGGSILIGWSSRPIIDTNVIYEKNPAYYSARDKRNEQRRKILNDWVLAHEFVDNLNEYIDAKNRWHKLESKYFSFEDRMFVVQYEIKKLIKGDWEHD